MTTEGDHEPVDRLSPEAMDFQRAVVSLIEGPGATTGRHRRRVDARADPASRAVRACNRDGVIAPAAMLLEWNRRENPVFDGELRETPYNDGPIAGRYRG